ncbi:branched-chain amino acid ABC transporter permease [Fusibacillus kribbianus]|uniref:Branched-chain amino acid ABC transporter permease n=1 Tax=Fusibacillus kribbianus TaxID=3044208 RepID=A0AAP4BAU1_9FIRM|nr:branched-chain amino acid ABC transporter permease [Ruminococcus sp. YH-rum2234]MDI9241473.1 branched-chain amino acid ABC transporter permease [Ruminococcus sp. YH-rum2234]
MNLQLLISGMSMGIVYGLIAMGMVLIFRSVGIMNFAQGEFLMFGGYFCYTFNQILHLPIVVSLLLASLSMGVVGVLFMRSSYWPLRNAQAKAIIVSAMGASIAFKEGARLIWGSIPVSMDRVVEGTVKIGTASVQWQHIAIIVVSAVIMILVYILLEKTFIGNMMQATAQDQYMASLTGIPVIFSIGLTFALSAMITGVGGGLLAPIFFLNNVMGGTAGAKAFAAIVIGGFGSVPGAIIGGLIVGLVEAFGGAYISSTYQLVLIYVVLIAILMIRPQGIFGEKIQEKA